MATVETKHDVPHSEITTIKDLFLKLKEWFKYVLSKWLTILIIGLAGGVIGFIYASSKKPLYVAQLSFVLQDEKASGGVSGAIGLASQFGIDLGGGGGGQFSNENLLPLMRSRSMVEKALLTPVTINGKNRTLAQFYITFNNLRENWASKPGLSRIDFVPNADRSSFTVTQDSVLGTIYKAIIQGNLSVDKIDKKSSIISLKVSSSNELFSKYFVEVLAKVVSDFYVQTKIQKSTKNVLILQHQTDSIRRTLNNAISGVAASIDAAPNANPNLQTLRVPSQRRQVDVQANTAILSELIKNLEISKMALLQETPLISVIDRPILPLDIDKIGRAKGAILGAFIFGMLTVLFFLIKKAFRSIME